MSVQRHHHATPRYQGQLQLGFNSVVDADVLARTSAFIVTPPPRKIVRKVCRQNANALRDQAKADRAAGRETKMQRVHRCLAAFENFYTYWPTAAELTRYMAEKHEIPKDRVNLVAPRLSVGTNGDLKKQKDGTKVRVGGGLFELLPLRTCRVNGDQAHPYRIREAGSAPRS